MPKTASVGKWSRSTDYSNWSRAVVLPPTSEQWDKPDDPTPEEAREVRQKEPEVAECLSIAAAQAVDGVHGVQNPEAEAAECLDAAGAEGLESLYRESAPAAYAYLRSRGMDRDSASDLVHDAFVKIGRHMARDRLIESLRAFVLAVLGNTWRDWLRKAERGTYPTEAAGHGQSDMQSEDEFERAGELSDRRNIVVALRRALVGLPPRQRQ